MKHKKKEKKVSGQHRETAIKAKIARQGPESSSKRA